MKAKLNAIVLAGMLTAFGASAENVTDLSGWVVEDNRGSTADWSYKPESNTWYQKTNTNGFTYLYDPNEQSLGKAISGTISVKSSGDDDYIGFVVGYNAGELNQVDSEYMLLTWKQADQGVLTVGMDLYLIQGALGRDSGNSLALENKTYATQLGNSASYADAGWKDYESYTFDIAYQHNYLAIFVNDVLQYAATPDMVGLDSFSEGGFGFFNYSQNDVEYGSVLYDDVEILLDDEKKKDIVSAVPVTGFGIITMLLAGAPLLRSRKIKLLA